MVKRLSADSSRVRKDAATLLQKTLRDEKMEMDESGVSDDSGDLGDVIVKLDILRDSEDAIASLIKAWI